MILIREVGDEVIENGRSGQYYRIVGTEYTLKVMRERPLRYNAMAVMLPGKEEGEHLTTGTSQQQAAERAEEYLRQHYKAFAFIPEEVEPNDFVPVSIGWSCAHNDLPQCTFTLVPNRQDLQFIVRQVGEHNWMAINLSVPRWGCGQIIAEGQSDMQCLSKAIVELNNSITTEDKSIWGI